MKKLLLTIAVLVSALGMGGTECFAQGSGSSKKCPLVALQRGVTMEIVDMFFLKKVNGASGNALSVNEDNLDKHRIALVTVKVTKPAGTTLELAACDVTLHYYHGEKIEAAPCEGISAFNKTRDEDRSMNLPRVNGPSFTKTKTGVRASQDTTVYFDVVFQGVEPEIRQAWICVGQPTQSEPFHTKGWEK